MCSTRVVPACRREGSSTAATCDPAAQYFAWPSRRVAQVVRRYDETYGTGVLSSICRDDHGDFARAMAAKITSRFCH